jgi:hypothetical protein
MSEKYGRAENVTLRTILGESFLVMLHTGGSKMFTLNRMGVWFWEHLETPADKDSLLAAMLEHFAVDEPRAKGEVDRFLSDLVSKGLVRVV